MFELFHEPKINFMRWKWLWLGISAVTITFSLIYVPIHGIKQAVEFTGGVEVSLRYVQPPSLDQIRSELEGGAGQDTIDPDLGGGIERPALEIAFPGVVDQQYQHGQRGEPGGGASHVPGAPERDQNEHWQGPQQAVAEHLAHPLQRPLLGAPAVAELLGQQPAGGQHHQGDAK